MDAWCRGAVPLSAKRESPFSAWLAQMTSGRPSVPTGPRSASGRESMRQTTPRKTTSGSRAVSTQPDTRGLRFRSATAWGHSAPAHHLASDEHALHLAGPLVDRGHAGVPVEAGDVELFHEAVAA